MASPELAPGDNDLDTPRYVRDPSYGGTGQRAPLIRLEYIRVPNHPAYARATGRRCSTLWWCEECERYEDAADRDCQRGSINPNGRGAI